MIQTPTQHTSSLAKPIEIDNTNELYCVYKCHKKSHKMKKESNAIKYPEAWSIYKDCVRKWQEKDLENYPTGWRYGIPNPQNFEEYLYSNCPGKLFQTFKRLFYREDKIIEIRKFLWRLENAEGKISSKQYESNLKYLKYLA